MRKIHWILIAAFLIPTFLYSGHLTGFDAIEFEVKTWATEDGNPIDLAHLKGRYAVIAFFESKSKKCVSVMPDLVSLNKALWDLPATLLALTSEYKTDKLQQFFWTHDIKFPVGCGAQDGHKYSIPEKPYFLLLDKAHKIIYDGTSLDDLKTELGKFVKLKPSVLHKAGVRDDQKEDGGNEKGTVKDFLADIDTYWDSGLPTMEELLAEGPFLAEYFATAKKNRKPIIFVMSDYNLDKIKMHFNSSKLKSSFTFMDIRLSLKRMDNTSTRLASRLEDYASPYSLSSSHSATYMVGIDGKTLYSIGSSSLSSIQKVCYLMAANRKLTNDKTYVLFRKLSEGITDASTIARLRKPYISSCSFPEPLNSLIKKARKTGDYYLVYLSAFEKRETNEIKMKKKELEELYSPLKVEVLTKESKIRSIIFGEDPYQRSAYRTANPSKYIMFLGATGVLTSSSYVSDMSRQSAAFYQRGLHCIEKKEFKKAIKLFEACAGILGGSTSSFYAHRKKASEQIIEKLKALEPEKF